MVLAEQILTLIKDVPGLSDREITNRLRGESAPQQPINIAARGLEKRGLLVRRKRLDELLGNFPSNAMETTTSQPSVLPRILTTSSGLSEDELKETIAAWLLADGWESKIAWGKQRGVDILALRGDERWFIEVKGIGSRPEMRVNYFIGILGETLQRMNDQDAKYSIALPDVPQFRRLWQRLPQLAKKRTEITALFVTSEGDVFEVIE